MTISDLIQHIPQNSPSDLIIKASGLGGGGIFMSGFMLEPSMISAIGQLMGGLAALLTICYTIYKGRNK